MNALPTKNPTRRTRWEMTVIEHGQVIDIQEAPTLPSLLHLASLLRSTSQYKVRLTHYTVDIEGAIWGRTYAEPGPDGLPTHYVNGDPVPDQYAAEYRAFWDPLKVTPW